MCGIVGYIGKKQAAPLLKEGLKKLEYRGYDSAGIAVLGDRGLAVEKRAGRVDALSANVYGNCGIGHTRWATHGAPTAENAHPHVCGAIALVHNGIVENAHELRRECMERGEKFFSETDSEVIAHLIARAYRGDLLAAVKEGCARLVGSYALAVLAKDRREIVCARMKSPLIVGRGEDGCYAASDLAALPACSAACVLSDGDFALLNGENFTVFDAGLQPKEGEKVVFSAKEEDGALGGYRHYMRKEMAEIPLALENSCLEIGNIGDFSGFYEVLCHAEYIQIVACGTAYHAALCFEYAAEKLCRIPVEVTTAGEYRYRDPIVPKNTLCLAVSQSGETADTLAAALCAREKGAKVAAVVNVAHSSLARMADFVLPTRAGAERAVAATKSFHAQLAALYSVLRALAAARGTAAPYFSLAKEAEEALALSEKVQGWAARFAAARSVYFIGRGADYCAALEGSLKLKEISYLPSEGYAAGELKHGTLALVDGRTPVVAIVTSEALAEKTMNAVSEVRARGAGVYLITTLASLSGREGIADAVLLPPCEELYSPALTAIPLQMLAYYTALACGNDPDKPRNLAKSVTVE